MTDSEPEIKYLGDVQRLVLKHGDTVVLTVSEPVSQETANRLKASLQAILGDDYRYIILDSNIKLGVLGQDIAA